MPATPATRSTGSSRNSRRPQPYPQRRRGFPMAKQAKRPHIGKITLPAAFRHRHDVIGIPQRLSAPLPQTPLLQKQPARRIIQLPHIPPDASRIHTALRANPVVPLKYPLPQIPGIGPKLPIMYAAIGAKCAPAFRNFDPAPSAKRTSARPSLHLGRLNPPALFGSRQRGRIAPNVNSELTT